MRSRGSREVENLDLGLQPGSKRERGAYLGDALSVKDDDGPHNRDARATREPAADLLEKPQLEPCGRIGVGRHRKQIDRP